MPLEPGITRVGNTLKARVEVGGREYAQRFPLDTDVATIRAWRTATRAAAAASRADFGDAPIVRGRPPTVARGTLEEDVARYLPLLAGRPGARADRSHLRAWLALILRGVRVGLLPRARITTELVQLAIAQWRTAPSAHHIRRVRVAAATRHGVLLPGYERAAPVTSGHVVAEKTIRHRCRVLQTLYRALDGKRAATPVDDATLPRIPKTIPITVDVRTVVDVAAALARAAAPRPLVHRYRSAADHAAALARAAARRHDRHQTYARFVVLATTGQRPCQVMRARPEDLDFRRGTWIVRAAKLEPAHTITLTTDMVQAWLAFQAAAAWGAYDTTRHAQRVHAAGWPRGVRPYNARHSLMADALALGIDLSDVQGLAGHASPLTTRTFYGALAVARQRQVSDKLEGRLRDIFEPRLVGLFGKP